MQSTSPKKPPKKRGPKKQRRLVIIYLIIIALCIGYFFWVDGPIIMNQFSGAGQSSQSAQTTSSNAQNTGQDPSTEAEALYNGFFGGGAKTDMLTTSSFVNAVGEDRVKTATWNTESGEVKGSYWQNKDDIGNDDKLVNYKSTYASANNLEDLMAQHPSVIFNIDTSNDSVGWQLLITFLPTVLLILGMIFIMNRASAQNANALSFGKVKKQGKQGEHPKVRFKDVAGIDEAVEEIAEIRDFLKSPQRFQKMGAKIPHGVLLMGPPGTGKTLLAKAVAGEADVPFYSISGSDFVEMFVGVGASRVRDLFKQAKQSAPSIIFIDEIDAVGRQRGAGLGGGHDEREQTLNQLLVEMDGFEDHATVILIAATNRPDVLDPALLRPGRFDRQITVDRPDVAGREQILKVHAEGKPFAADIAFDSIAKLTPGFTGADLANLLNEAALLAARRNKKEISMNEIEEAMERVIAGPERKSRVVSDKERATIAYHESGHALVGHLLEDADPVHKITIVPRGQALGYTLSLPEQDHFLESRSTLLDQITTLLGGRAAEKLFCSDITTGASNDIERATKLARQMVTRFGMSDVLGNQVFGEAQHEVFLGRDLADKQDYSPDTAKLIDDEVAKIMQQSMDRAIELLSKHKDRMKTMAEVLLIRETVEGDAMQALLNGTWDEYLKNHPEEAERQKEAMQGKPEPPAGDVAVEAALKQDNKRAHEEALKQDTERADEVALKQDAQRAEKAALNQNNKRAQKAAQPHKTKENNDA